ncbi:MAG: PilZ domain-containing protein [Deltaproteobacteria bacterium]|nr:PilZ domain-containing protein [Deltaproteobacteria bacterium]
MAVGRERRRFERFSLDEEVFCYVAGERIDACSRDISAGGMFLETRHAHAVEMGSIVGLVLQSYRGQERPVYLFGRVVRKQDQPNPGLGLQWEHAVTLATPGKLAGFLGNLFKMPIVDVRLDPMSGGRFRSVYVFPGAPRDAPRIPEDATDADPLPPRRAPEDGRSGWAARPGSAPLPPDSRGAISQMVRRSEITPMASLRAVVTAGGETHRDAVITRIDAIGFYVRTVSALRVRTGGPATVSFAIRTPSGTAEVTAQCVLARADDLPMGAPNAPAVESPGHRLLIRKLDEGRNKGIYERFVRWLSFKALSARPAGG